LIRSVLAAEVATADWIDPGCGIGRVIRGSRTVLTILAASEIEPGGAVGFIGAAAVGRRMRRASGNGGQRQHQQEDDLHVSDHPFGLRQEEVAMSQMNPVGQQAVQPHRLVPGAHSARHAPPTHCWPHPHGGLHCAVTQPPPWQTSPVGQMPAWQVPPHPSLAPQFLPVQSG
jgi:hypothetical protein